MACAVDYFPVDAVVVLSDAARLAERAKITSGSWERTQASLLAAGILEAGLCTLRRGLGDVLPAA